jgi:hypothetical protein
VEVLWQLSLLVLPVVAVQLSVLHVAVWLALMLYVLEGHMMLKNLPLFRYAAICEVMAGST